MTRGVRRSSDEDEAELTVWITAALAASGRHLPESAAAGRRGGVPAGHPTDDAVAAAPVAEAATHRYRLALDTRHGALYQRSGPRCRRRRRLTARLSVDHRVLGAVSDQHSINDNHRVYAVLTCGAEIK